MGSPPLRVLFAITRGETGGAQQHLRVLALGLLRRGHQVGVVVEAGSPLFEDVESAGGRLFEWRSITRNPNPARDLRARRELGRTARSFSPDVLSLYSSKAGVLGRRLLPPGRGVTIFTCHHAPFGPGRQWSHRVMARPIEQLTLRLVDGIISDGARDMPLLRKLAPRVPMRLIPNAVELEDLPPATTGGRRTAIWVARLRRPKDPMQVVAAWDRLTRAVPDARLLVCGDGPLRPKVEQRVAALRDPATVELLGYVPTVRPHQRAASIFVLASDVEGGLTMATLDAMSQGLVPVVSDVGDAFLLEHHGCGVVVPRRSSATMAEAIRSLFEDPDRVSDMRERAIHYAREVATPDRFVENTVSFYRDLLR